MHLSSVPPTMWMVVMQLSITKLYFDFFQSTPPLFLKFSIAQSLVCLSRLSDAVVFPRRSWTLWSASYRGGTIRDGMTPCSLNYLQAVRNMSPVVASWLMSLSCSMRLCSNVGCGSSPKQSISPCFSVRPTLSSLPSNCRL